MTQYEQRRIIGIVLIIVGVFVVGGSGMFLLPFPYGFLAVLVPIIIGVILIVRKDPEVTHLDSHFGTYFCSKCGADLKPFNQYCEKCGTPV